MEKNFRTFGWESRWGDKCFEYLKDANVSFHKWWQDEFEEPAEPQERQEPQTAREKLEQAEVAEYEVLDDSSRGCSALLCLGN